MVGLMAVSNKPELTRSDRRAINKTESARRYADREARKAKRAPDSSFGAAGHALGAGAGARAEQDRQANSVVVLAEHGMALSAAPGSEGGEPTDERRQAVVVMRANGFTKKAIAAVLGIDLQTLEDRYSFEIEHGFALVANKIASAVAISALNGNQKDQHFWLRSRLGWGGDRAVNVTMAGMEPQMQTAGSPRFPPGMPAPGPDGKIVVTMNLGIPGHELGADDDDGDDDEGGILRGPS